MARKFQRILGINFFVGDMADLLELCAGGHFVVVPAAPALIELPTDAAYREAVEKSDFAITDSALMVLLWKWLAGESLPRISGLKLLRGLLAGRELRKAGSSFWIMPSKREMEVNLAWLNKNGHPITPEDCFVAPIYPKGAIFDPSILGLIEARKPPYIIVNLGGGVQERLGLYLKNNLSYRPSIICVGAAIAFLTGLQADIPAWADTWMLGWFFRCLHAPGKFIPRYWKALRLVPILAKYRDRSCAPAEGNSSAG
ncbi:MAG TPA: WecB/TagA/CpsF family glycosyltransferase [Candidatus Methylacidiphilales bacterium]|jgi:UDP-N-acetyl-D-mannosaminuronic acid transferase (WecB/TagA/CpsF family)|nr:WecB/TagA/CpsF family glycosyltransferase [Candidatus Methylacidiphilales bacterium]